MKIHNVLLRQLKHYQLSEVIWPTTLETWQKMIERVNKTYFDFDFDRSMIDRSQEISSREMYELNRSFEKTEQIAHIGSWVFDIEENRIIISSEGGKILGINRISTPVISYEDFLAMIHKTDRAFFEEKIHSAIQQKTGFALDIKINSINTPRWINIQTQAICNEEGNLVVKLAGTIMDINLRKSAEQRKNMEHDVLNKLIESESVEDIIKKILQIICEAFNWKIGIFWQWDDQKQLLVRKEIWAENADIVKAYLELVPKDTTSVASHFLMQKIWETQNPYCLDIEKETIVDYNDFIKKVGIKSAFGFPIMSQEKPVSALEVLDFFSVDKEVFDTAIATSLKVVSHQLGLFIEKQQIKERELILNKELITSARLAGKAEVAVSVLHNVCNILNSINVSVTLLEEKLVNSALLNSFIKINQRLREHEKDFNQYIINDPQGKQLPKYLNLFEKALTEERDSVINDIERLKSSVQHVKDVIITQQGLTATIGTIESLSISTEIEVALSFVGFDTSCIIERHYEYKYLLLIDKVKLMQILVNLLRNAKDALLECEQSKKQIIIVVKKEPGNIIEVQVTDNGIGIEPQNLTRIFSFGFTTKKTGHGFGLQASALLAKEMGGSLRALSEGIGKGATFILTLPEKRIGNE